MIGLRLNILIMLHVQVLGTDSSSFTYWWVQNGYLSEHNAVIFWTVSTYLAVIISWCPKIVIVLGPASVPVTLSQFLHKNILRSTVIKLVILCVWPFNINGQKPFSSVSLEWEFFFTISIFTKEALETKNNAEAHPYIWVLKPT